MSEDRLTDLLHRLTPEPPTSIDLPAMARRITDDQPAPGPNRFRALRSGSEDPAGSALSPLSTRRRLLPALTAAAAIAAIALATVTVVSHRADEAGPSSAGSGGPAPSSQQLNRAQEVLNRWDRAVADSTTGHPTVSPLPEKGQFNLAIESAAIAPDHLTLTVRFPGAPEPASQPCGADYRAVAVESGHGVAVIVMTTPHGKNELCNGAGRDREAVVHLNQPLAGRTVLEISRGLPVPVTGSR